jgi:hypothetical protein
MNGTAVGENESEIIRLGNAVAAYGVAPLQAPSSQQRGSSHQRSWSN